MREAQRIQLGQVLANGDIFLRAALIGPDEQIAQQLHAAHFMPAPEIHRREQNARDAAWWRDSVTQVAQLWRVLRNAPFLIKSGSRAYAESPSSYQN